MAFLIEFSFIYKSTCLPIKPVQSAIEDSYSPTYFYPFKTLLPFRPSVQQVIGGNLYIILMQSKSVSPNNPFRFSMNQRTRLNSFSTWNKITPVPLPAYCPSTDEGATRHTARRYSMLIPNSINSGSLLATMFQSCFSVSSDNPLRGNPPPLHSAIKYKDPTKNDEVQTCHLQEIVHYEIGLWFIYHRNAAL